MRPREILTRSAVIMAVRARRRWVLLTPFHLIEQVGWLRWRTLTCIPLSMLVYIQVARRRAWAWAVLWFLSGILILAKLARLDVLRPFPLVLLFLVSFFSAVMYLFRSTYSATFIAPGCSIQVAVSVFSGEVLLRFCRLVVECQEGGVAALPPRELLPEGEKPQRPQLVSLPPARRSQRREARRTLSPVRWH